VHIIEGTHKDKEAKILSIKKDLQEEVDQNQVISVELICSGAILSTKRKRVMLSHIY
jgi:hypothetical protein